MSPARTARAKTLGIILLAGAVAFGALLLSRAEPAARSAPVPPPATAGSAGGVSLRAMLQSSHVLRGTHETYLALTVSGNGRAQTARPPLNLAVVIDRSGSMTGEKLADAKRAAAQLLSELGERDRFSVISYGSDVEVVFASQPATASARAAAAIAIDGIYDSGGTNISGGLVAGKQQLLNNPVAGAVSRIVLLSDGMANEGLFSPEELASLAADTADHGVSITTVGIGLDFDERTMTRIAVAGHGNYYFAESTSALSDLFWQELAKLGATVATDLELTVSPAAGVDLLEALGYPMYQTAGIVIPVADLHAGEHRKIVLRLRVSANQPGSIDLLGYRATFRPVGAADVSRVEGSARAEVTADVQTWRSNLNGDAALYIERARAAGAIDEATALYEQGRGQEAEQVLEEYDRNAQQLSADYGDDEISGELEGQVMSVTRNARKKLKEAPRPASAAGKQSSKSNRAQAYDLFVK